MALDTVTIIPGTETPLGIGITGAIKCLVRLPDGSMKSAIVKNMSPQAVAAEAFCALLLRGWGLSVPEPAIVSSPLAFASMDVGYPNMMQKIGWNDSFSPSIKAALERACAELVSTFPETPLALAADEAIENRDRNLGNILWDGTNVSWIDHERSLGVTPLPDANKLANMALMSSNTATVQHAAVSIARTLNAESIKAAGNEGAAFPDSAAFAMRVADNLQQLAEAVLARFPQPPGLFSVR
jgi:hypothetical protein